MLNKHNNVGNINTSNQQIKNILEMIHQVNLRIPSTILKYAAFKDIIIDEDCLLGNPWGHKYIHKSGEQLKGGIYQVYYSTKWHYYVIESRVVIPIHILRKIKKGLNIIDRMTLLEIGTHYVQDLQRAFDKIAEHQFIVNGSSPIRECVWTEQNINYELSNIATAIVGNIPNYTTRPMTGMRIESKLRAPLTMMFTILYRTMNDACLTHDVATTKLIDPVYYYRKWDVDMAYVLSYINEIDWANEGFESVHHIHYCWDAIERNLMQLNIFMQGESTDVWFRETHYPELNDDRIADLYNLLLHLYFHEMGHVKYGLDCDEAEADEWAKTVRTLAKSQIEFRCDDWPDIMRRIFINYSHYLDECSNDN